MEIGMDVSPPSSKILYSSTFPTLDSNRRSFEIATPGGRLVSVCKRAETIATTRNVQLQFSRFLRSGFNFGRKLGTRRSVVQVEPAKDTMTLRISDNIFRYSFFIPSHFKISRLSIFSFLSLAFDSKKANLETKVSPSVNLLARKRRNDAQPIKIPSGRSSSIFPTRCRLTSAGRIKFQPRSVAGVIVSAFTHHGTEELILRFDRGNKIRNGGSTPTSTSSNSITITVATLFSRRKVDSSGKMD